jgi:hypothetical protein
MDHMYPTHISGVPITSRTSLHFVAFAHLALPQLPRTPVRPEPKGASSWFAIHASFPPLAMQRSFILPTGLVV